MWKPRAIGIASGVAISLILHNIFGVSHWVSMLFGIAAYFAGRFVSGSIIRGRQFQRELDRLVADYHQGKPLRDDEGRPI